MSAISPTQGTLLTRVTLTAAIVAFAGLAVTTFQFFIRPSLHNLAAGEGQTQTVPESRDNSESRNRFPVFAYTHKVSPVIDEDVPELKIALPVINRTGGPVKFERVTHSCSCADASLRVLDLAADAETTLDMTVSLRGKSGSHRLFAFLDDDKGRSWNYEIETTIYPRARFQAPNNVLHEAHIDPEERRTCDVTLELFSSDYDSLPQTTSVAADTAEYKVTCAEGVTERLSEHVWVRRIPVSISYRAPSSPGPYFSQVTAQYSYRGANRTVALAISGAVKSLYQVAPQYVFFDQVRPMDGPVCKRVIVRRTDGRAIRILDVHASEPKVKVEAKVSDDGTTALLNLTLESIGQTMPVFGTVTITTDHEKQPRLCVEFAAITTITSMHSSPSTRKE